MNGVFENNLQSLSKKNPDLAQRLKNYIPTELPQLVKESNSFNLEYKGELIHNKENPVEEAFSIFSLAENSPVAIHLIYGLGLGYLFQVASTNSKGSVILYEPDLNILRITFSLVDFSKDIEKNNVYISDNYESVAKAIYQNSATKNSPQLLSIPSQRKFNPDKFDELVSKLKTTVGAFSLDLKYTQANFYPALKMLFTNIPNLFKEIPLARLKDAYKGKTAIVVSAGPTLDRNIEVLKKYRDNYILFVVGTAAKTLAQHGIKPDFLVIIETYNSAKQLEGLDLEDVNFITEPYANPELRNFKFKQIYSHISANTPINHFWSEICSEEIEEYWSKGTVSYTALNSARILGCSKIILVGQDLAYIDGQCYSKDSAYKDLYCGINPETNRWEIMARDMEKFSNAISTSPDPNIRMHVANHRLTNLNKSLHLIKGINGDMLPTESVYVTFVEPLQEFVRHFNDRVYINTSLVGAQLDGYENMSLEDALKDSTPIESRELTTDFNFNKTNICENIKDRLNDLQTAEKLIEEGQKISKNLRNSLKRTRSVDTELLKTLKKLTINYLSLSNDFTKRSKLFDFMTISEKIDIDYLMKVTDNFTIESITNICNEITKYFDIAQKNIEEIKTLAGKVLNEITDTKS